MDGVGVYGVSKSMLGKEKTEERVEKTAGGGAKITRTEPGCKCLRTCPLGWSEWQRELDGGERSENAAYTHRQRVFLTLVFVAKV